MNPDKPHTSLDRTFHEPNRLAIMSSLCGSPRGLSFSELRDMCSLTDGNLNRHLKTLQEAGAVYSRKGNRSRKTNTMIFISDLGRNQFVDYLKTLETVLSQAVSTMAPEEKAHILSAITDNGFELNPI
jgi:DNA-binding transcriptional ArsR family regulator